MDKGYWINRRSIRNFLTKDVDDAILFDLIEKAAKAPTTGNMQLYSVIITRDEARRKQLAECHFNQPASKAPVLLTVTADFNRFEKWCRQRGAEPGFDNFESFVAALLDAVIFTQQLNTLLELNGLGCCYLGTATYTASRIGEMLKLPRLVVPVTSLAIGWPADNGVETDRLAPGALIHHEVYDDYTEDRIDEIYAPKEALEENKAYVRENSKPSLAHVFTDIRYPEKNALAFSKDFYEYIKKQGFSFPEK